MSLFPPTIILRHRKENLKKCSLKGLEERSDFHFLTYPLSSPLPDLSHYLILTMDGPPLTSADAPFGLFLLDGTWRYASKMFQTQFKENLPQTRTLPSHFQTAYPRVQNDCPDPMRGLASIEALFVAYSILGRNTSGLLDHYHWKSHFLDKNNF
jgi:pre-rRNA-processing protein TSR3